MSEVSTAHLEAEMIARLRAAFAPIELELHNESAEHAGHAGAQAGGQHFLVRIVSAQFSDINSLARHRCVYNALSDLIPYPIHALRIDARGV